ncbi:20357_t:CDS:1, partial [Entrophospora sp. SA101]
NSENNRDLIVEQEQQYNEKCPCTSVDDTEKKNVIVLNVCKISIVNSICKHINPHIK